MGERQVLQPAWNKPVNWRKWRDSNPFCHIEIAKKRRIARGGGAERSAPGDPHPWRPDSRPAFGSESYQNGGCGTDWGEPRNTGEVGSERVAGQSKISLGSRRVPWPRPRRLIPTFGNRSLFEACCPLPVQTRCCPHDDRCLPGQDAGSGVPLFHSRSGGPARPHRTRP